MIELWFLAIAIAGGAVITAHPQILAALDPFRASGFITHHELGRLEQSYQITLI